MRVRVCVFATAVDYRDWRPPSNEDGLQHWHAQHVHP